jgi:16S rRNA (guanine966-N2)-methyltransferase
MVKEAVFDILESLGVLRGAWVADLFAGTGSIGIEALSRGARRVSFVEKNPQVARLVKANLKATKLDGREHDIVVADAISWCRATPKLEIVICDPPYAFSAWEELLGVVNADLVVMESSSPPDQPPSWEFFKTRRYGGTLITMARPVKGEVE